MSLSRKKEKRKKKRSPVEILGLLAIAAFIAGLLWLAFSSPSTPSTPSTNPGQTTSPLPAHSLAPDFLLTDVDGKNFKLSDYRGKVVVLEFMQTTCEYCQAQEPRMKELRSRFPGDVVMVIISINPGDTEEILRQYRDQNLVGWIAIRDTSEVSSAYNVSGTPTIFIIDKNGDIAFQHVGFTDSDSAPALISEISSLA
jgi:cytochrome oxidase Cu insertion factor (SCO1/SenC/PrrC family)